MPTQREVKEQLAEAMGPKRLRYVKGHGKQKAGYFPWDTDAPTLHLTGVDTARRAQERNGTEYGDTPQTAE